MACGSPGAPGPGRGQESNGNQGKKSSGDGFVGERGRVLQQDQQENGREPNPALREATFQVFRRWGFLQTTLDPLGQYLPPEPFPVAVPEGEEDSAAEARRFYCGTIGIEFMHIANGERRQWLQEQMEQDAPKGGFEPNQAQVLTQLIKADLFEQVIQSTLPGNQALFARRSDRVDFPIWTAPSRSAPRPA